ncbi:MAG: glycosyltransferase family 2 protein [Proteobacteria bacterium]|nr:MAG: glycosyltransferase family 2 protein [Pseudomonadota bacterium]
MMQLSLVVPAYNEERRLPKSLREIAEFVQHQNSPSAAEVEVVVVIEKSSDSTLESARKTTEGFSFFRVVDNVVHKGKGYAVKSGMLKAEGSLVIFMDADLSTPLTEVTKFVEYFQTHPETDVLIGSRALARGMVEKKQSWMRQTLGRGFNVFVQTFGVRGIKDTQCGFKAFRSEAAREIFSRATLNGFAFDVEVLILAQALGYKIDEMPVRWINSEDSKVRVLIDPLKMLWDLLRIRLIVRKTLKANPKI